MVLSQALLRILFERASGGLLPVRLPPLELSRRRRPCSRRTDRWDGRAKLQAGHLFAETSEGPPSSGTATEILGFCAQSPSVRIDDSSGEAKIIEPKEIHHGPGCNLRPRLGCRGDSAVRSTSLVSGKHPARYFCGHAFVDPSEATTFQRFLFLPGRVRYPPHRRRALHLRANADRPLDQRFLSSLA